MNSNDSMEYDHATDAHDAEEALRITEDTKCATSGSGGSNDAIDHRGAASDIICSCFESDERTCHEAYLRNDNEALQATAQPGPNCTSVVAMNSHVADFDSGLFSAVSNPSEGNMHVGLGDTSNYQSYPTSNPRRDECLHRGSSDVFGTADDVNSSRNRKRRRRFVFSAGTNEEQLLQHGAIHELRREFKVDFDVRASKRHQCESHSPPKVLRQGNREHTPLEWLDLATTALPDRATQRRVSGGSTLSALDDALSEGDEVAVEHNDVYVADDDYDVLLAPSGHSQRVPRDAAESSHADQQFGAAAVHDDDDDLSALLGEAVLMYCSVTQMRSNDTNSSGSTHHHPSHHHHRRSTSGGLSTTSGGGLSTTPDRRLTADSVSSDVVSVSSSDTTSHTAAAMQVVVDQHWQRAQYQQQQRVSGVRTRVNELLRESPLHDTLWSYTTRHESSTEALRARAEALLQHVAQVAELFADSEHAQHNEEAMAVEVTRAHAMSYRHRVALGNVISAHDVEAASVSLLQSVCTAAQHLCVPALEVGWCVFLASLLHNEPLLAAVLTLQYHHQHHHQARPRMMEPEEEGVHGQAMMNGGDELLALVHVPEWSVLQRCLRVHVEAACHESNNATSSTTTTATTTVDDDELMMLRAVLHEDSVHYVRNALAPLLLHWRHVALMHCDTRWALMFT